MAVMLGVRIDLEPEHAKEDEYPLLSALFEIEFSGDGYDIFITFWKPIGDDMDTFTTLVEMLRARRGLKNPQQHNFEEALSRYEETADQDQRKEPDY